MNISNAVDMNAKWKSQLGIAKFTWNRLTDDELMKSQGHPQRLAVMVQTRYSLTREIAEKQVQNFLKSLA